MTRTAATPRTTASPGDTLTRLLTTDLTRFVESAWGFTPVLHVTATSRSDSSIHVDGDVSRPGGVLTPAHRASILQFITNWIRDVNEASAVALRSLAGVVPRAA
ncbi:hypothetical protein [Pseudoclavibacter sp. VKM Ac-2888]|uniref:hypothetical protein n=1 Tax=Pseudoclavibacter sp. VKM Ac-2888 TaxID=2783830 RepID=UPI00188C4029|nr:hypothetical protein [Pseudoclavibacter sp. VKM Ac-2888]MBF4549307.1 hypothetical protein [Pseudoclavibacter sp. VKM Ac-2888]